MIQSSCDPICLHSKGLVADQTLRRCCASGSRAHNCFFFFFSHICLTHEETHESIAVINQNSALFVYDKKIYTGIQTIFPL